MPYYELPVYRTTGASAIPARKLYANFGGKFEDVETKM